MPKLNNFLKFVVSITAPLLAGFVGSFFTFSSIENWYVYLNKPALNPPSWVFSPVWTVLYILMGIGLFLVWKRGFDRKDIKIAMSVFGVQLVLNTLWSIIFFGTRNPGLAFVDILLLWVSILITTVLFFRISKIAAWLLVPYIVWVSFAAYLNYGIWILN